MALMIKQLSLLPAPLQRRVHQVATKHPRRLLTAEDDNAVKGEYARGGFHKRPAY